MQKYCIVCAVLLSAPVVQARKAKDRADVIVYMRAASVPSAVDFGARSQVTWLFNKMGVRIVWRDGEPEAAKRSEAAWVIRVDFNSRVLADVHPGALAYATPFSDAATTITVMYDRIEFAVATKPGLARTVLAHVLAHELGHALQQTNRHAPDGVMKAHWTAADYDAMAKRPLPFSPVDIELIHEGLLAHKARRE
jgi:hypothetical protein